MRKVKAANDFLPLYRKAWICIFLRRHSLIIDKCLPTDYNITHIENYTMR